LFEIARLFNLHTVLMHPNFAGGERGDNEALSAHTKALLDWVQQRFLLFCLTLVDPFVGPVGRVRRPGFDKPSLASLAVDTALIARPHALARSATLAIP
jgi:hypothetical protein